MKCLSCGSSVEKNDDNACSYCGSVIRVDTFKSLLSIVSEVKDAFKFSTSEQTIDKLPVKEQNDAYHTHLLILIDRKLWKDVEVISLKARNKFPTDAMFDIYNLIALICQNRLINKGIDEIKQIINSLTQDKNRIPINIKGFFIDAINILWCRKKKINEFNMMIVWKPDSELKSLTKILGTEIVNEIDIDSKLKTSKNNKNDSINKLIDEIVYNTNYSFEKDFITNYDKGIDTVSNFAKKEIVNPDYKKNIIDMINFYKVRSDKYKEAVKNMNGDFSKENLEKHFEKINETNKIWLKEIPLGSFFKRLVLFIIISIILIMNLDMNPNVNIFLILVSVLIAWFSISNRKEKKKMSTYEVFLKTVPVKISSEIEEIKSSMRFI